MEWVTPIFRFKYCDNRHEISQSPCCICHRQNKLRNIFLSPSKTTSIQNDRQGMLLRLKNIRYRYSPVKRKYQLRSRWFFNFLFAFNFFAGIHRCRRRIHRRRPILRICSGAQVRADPVQLRLQRKRPTNQRREEATRIERRKR